MTKIKWKDSDPVTPGVEEADETGLAKLTRDLKAAVSNLTPREVRYLVDTYYQMQENRKRADGQVRALVETGEPHAVTDWLAKNSRFMENQVKSGLNAYVQSQVMGRWLTEHVGIGPVISAGFLAHFDFAKAPTYGHFWSFAGLTTGFNMPVKWEKGQKRPWNASLKSLCWKAGDCFVKFSGREDCFYGKTYVAHKAKLIERNERLEFKAAADDGLARVGKTTDAHKFYKIGKLPPGHIDARARRYAVKLFISHFWQALWWYNNGTEPPKPYPVAHQGHAHVVPCPIPWPAKKATVAKTTE